MTARRTQEERRREAERKLIDAAAELVVEPGPARVTLANVGERAGYSRGLVTHHFGAKGALMQRLVATVTHQFRERMFENRTAAGVLGELQTLMDIYFGVAADPQPVNRARLVLWAEALANPSSESRPLMVAADREFREAIEERLLTGITAGEIPASVDAYGLATVIVAMLRGVVLQSVLDPQLGADAQAATRTEIDQLLSARLNRESTT